MREAVTFIWRLSITLHYLDTGNIFEDLQFVGVISHEPIGVVLEMYLPLGRRSYCIFRNTVHRHFSLLFCTAYCATL